MINNLQDLLNEKGDVRQNHHSSKFSEYIAQPGHRVGWMNPDRAGNPIVVGGSVVLRRKYESFKPLFWICLSDKIKY